MNDLVSTSSTLPVAQLPAAGSPTGNAANAGQIRHAAGEFESILLNQWLEGAESSFGTVPGADDDQDAGDAQMKSFAVQTLAKGITAAGGVGLASLVAKALAAHAPGHAKPDAQKR